MTMIAAFSSDTAYEALADLRVFEAHPESLFSIGGVLTRVSPFPSFQVLSHSLLTSASGLTAWPRQRRSLLAGDAARSRPAEAVTLL